MAVIILAIVVILIILILMLLKGCESKSSPTPAQATEPDNVSPADAAASGTEAAPADTTGSITAPTEAGNVTPTTAPNAQKPTTPPAPKPTTPPAPKPTNPPTPKPTDPHADMTYHEAEYKIVHHDAVYEDVYVVDQAAYSYEEPIYEERQITVCHVCGAEFDTSYSTKEFSAHNKAHALAGEGSGYHSDVRKIQVGTNTVNVPEKGHYEKQLVKAAWDEKILVKEAGWY